jgi:putative oxidoreductase
MFDVEAERIPNRTDGLATWLPRIAIAVAFTGIGVSKFRDPMWVRLFAQIGFGQWFRYFTGAMQIAGALLTLVPRASAIGIAMLAATMAGAVITWISFGQPFVTIIPGAILLALLAAGAAEFYRVKGQA